MSWEFDGEGPARRSGCGFAAGDEANLGVLLELLNQEQLGWGLRRDEATLCSAVRSSLPQTGGRFGAGMDRRRGNLWARIGE